MSADQSIETVEYRLIEGYDEYRVGSDGSVWTLWHRGGGAPWSIGTEWQRLGTHTDDDGRTVVNLTKNKKTKRFYVSRLVLLAFVGPCPEGMEGCHEDGNPANNNRGNLRWDTHVANIQDSIRHGTIARGSRQGMSKLKDDQVIEIRNRYASGTETYRSLAKDFGISFKMVGFIVKKQSWGWLES